MAQYEEEVTKVYVNQEGVAVIKCPACELVKTTKVVNFKGSRHVLNVKCTCKNVFLVNLEFRKAWRKEIKLPGDYILLPEKILRGRMMVVNISKTGVGLQIIGAHRLKAGEKLQVSFILDDNHGSTIDKKVVIRLVKGSSVGCEFLEATSHDRALGFYLMV
jgi:hypothetical protein